MSLCTSLTASLKIKFCIETVHQTEVALEHGAEKGAEILP